MFGRDQWGARAPKCSGGSRALSSISVAHVHYADAPAVVGSMDAEAAMVRSIQSFHMDGRGWCDIGYHRLVAMDGSLFEGRPLEEVGAETMGHNADSVGYCFLTDGPVTEQAWTAFLSQLRQDQDAIGHPLEVRPHSADVATSCPGDALRARISALAAPSAHPPPAPAPSTPPTPPAPAPADWTEEAIMALPTLTPGATGDVVRNAQALLATHAPLAVDGVFGPDTAAKVRDFQTVEGLAVDGVIGQETWTKLVTFGA